MNILNNHHSQPLLREDGRDNYFIYMKKLILIAIFFAITFLPKASWANENIASYESEFKINKDSSVDVTEKILYDFDTLQRHGIFRDIPYKYKARGGNFKLRISDISVTDDNGNKYNFSKTYSGEMLSLKIGDGDKYVTGKKMYIIKYKVKRALNYFDDHDELYWNAIGNGWGVPINNVSAKVILPEEVVSHSLANTVEQDCFVGNYGSQERCSFAQSGNMTSFTSRDLNPKEAATVVVGFPKGVVIKPSALSLLLETLKDNWIAFLPLIVLVFMFFHWRKKGKDPEGRGTIVARYTAPDDLSPLEIGTLVDEKAQNKDVSSQIIDLAVRGYIKIKKTDKKILLFNTTDYEFEKLKDTSDLSNDFDKEIMEGIFESGGVGKVTKMSDLKNKFYKNLRKIVDQSYKSLVDKGYFPKNPKTVKATYFGIGMAIVFISFFIGPFFGGIGIFSITISGAIVIIFSFIMSTKTKKGVLAREHILGLKEYMSVAEKDRIEFHNAPAKTQATQAGRPEKNPKHFEKLLPYALALGVSKEWGEQFKDIYKKQPDWYSDNTGNSFSSVALASSLGTFQSSANTVVSSSPSSASSGGSGFSGGGGGGGFGGGGGGSW